MRDEFGLTPLMYALRSGQLDRKICCCGRRGKLQRATKLSTSGPPLLHFAAMGGLTTFFADISGGGVGPNEDRLKRTPLMFAAAAGMYVARRRPLGSPGTDVAGRRRGAAHSQRRSSLAEASSSRC